MQDVIYIPNGFVSCSSQLDKEPKKLVFINPNITLQKMKDYCPYDFREMFTYNLTKKVWEPVRNETEWKIALQRAQQTKKKLHLQLMSAPKAPQQPKKVEVPLKYFNPQFVQQTHQVQQNPQNPNYRTPQNPQKPVQPAVTQKPVIPHQVRQTSQPSRTSQPVTNGMFQAMGQASVGIPQPNMFGGFGRGGLGGGLGMMGGNTNNIFQKIQQMMQSEGMQQMLRDSMDPEVRQLEYEKDIIISDTKYHLPEDPRIPDPKEYYKREMGIDFLNMIMNPLSVDLVQLTNRTNEFYRKEGGMKVWLKKRNEWLKSSSKWRAYEQMQNDIKIQRERQEKERKEKARKEQSRNRVLRYDAGSVTFAGNLAGINKGRGLHFSNY